MKRMLKIDPVEPSPEVIDEVADAIRQGAVVVYPTETLYGLGANPFSPAAVKRLCQIKGRQHDKPIPFLIKDVQMLEALVEEVPSIGTVLIERYWPGPLTLVFRAKHGLPDPLFGVDGKIGVRVSSHPIARMLVEALGTPLTATSANRAGGEDLIDVRAIIQSFDRDVDLLIDGGSVPGVGSTVVDLSVTPPKILRRGMIRELSLEDK